MPGGPMPGGPPLPMPPGGGPRMPGGPPIMGGPRGGPPIRGPPCLICGGAAVMIEYNKNVFNQSFILTLSSKPKPFILAAVWK